MLSRLSHINHCTISSSLLRRYAWRLGAVLLLCTCHARGLPAQAAASLPHAAVSGRVATHDGKPVADAVVLLKAKDGTTLLTTITGPGGDFAFATLGSGTYTLVAKKGADSGIDTPVTVDPSTARPIDLLLDIRQGHSDTSAETGPPPLEPMEFSDKPAFAVAGVTDWTAAGGHGSDVALRTSEDLTRETLQLKDRSAENSSVGDAAKQETNLRAAVAATPANYAANRELGLFYLNRGRYSEALKPLQAASALEPAAAEGEYHLALTCQGLGDLAQARKHVQHALTLQDEAAYHRLSGELDEKLGDPLGAVQEEEVATHMAATEENYFTWGTELLLHRAIREATAVFAEGARLHPDSARLKTAWGAALFAGAEYEAAALRLCEASDLAPAKLEPYLFMGRIVVASPSPLPCLRPKLERFLQLHPQDPRAPFYSAMYLLKQSKPPEPQRAEALLQKAVLLSPKYAEAYLQLGILAFARRDYPAAVRFYDRSINADPQLAEAHYRLAVAYDRMGDAEGARREFALHESIQKTQADAVEQQRRQVKQFLIVLQNQPAASGKP